MSAYLTVPDTIDFLNKHNWDNITKQCHELNVWARDRVLAEFDIEPICNSMFLGQMSSIEFPFSDPLKNQIEFYNKYKIQIPFWQWSIFHCHQLVNTSPVRFRTHCQRGVKLIAQGLLHWISSLRQRFTCRCMSD